MRVNYGNSSIHVKVYCLLASGDIIGVQELKHHVKNIKDTSIWYILFIWTRHITKGICHCMVVDNAESKVFVKSVLQVGDMEFGIDKANDFAQLKLFYGYSFFGLDELHLIGANVTKKLWQIISGDFDTVVNTTIQLLNRACSAISNAIVASSATLPSGVFERSFQVLHHPLSHIVNYAGSRNPSNNIIHGLLKYTVLITRNPNDAIHILILHHNVQVVIVHP
ncbi:hypothetical protein BDA99DRAFT_598313 [Phascolomyces articulosus]|uniref:Uncharacterized protein n=1 Tax=Phascolomyces articulosus TaxID=60185 RepID=A0AAD5P6K3_9FUNG|nr:hypothetical protein BDA99DRAFT_598313 [Phascolomyces articulosus]